jgi:hypothetical protein
MIVMLIFFLPGFTILWMHYDFITAFAVMLIVIGMSVRETR